MLRSQKLFISLAKFSPLIRLIQDILIQAFKFYKKDSDFNSNYISYSSFASSSSLCNVLNSRFAIQILKSTFHFAGAQSSSEKKKYKFTLDYKLNLETFKVCNLVLIPFLCNQSNPKDFNCTLFVLSPEVKSNICKFFC